MLLSAAGSHEGNVKQGTTGLYLYFGLKKKKKSYEDSVENGLEWAKNQGKAAGFSSVIWR